MKAKTDITYCANYCENKCDRHESLYEFDKNEYYWFTTECIKNDTKCI